MRSGAREVSMRLLCAFALLGGCAGEPVDEDSEGILPPDDFGPELRAPVTYETGFYRGDPIAVFDFGPVDVRRNVDGEFAGGRVNPMYVFCRGVTLGPDPATPPTCDGPMWSVSSGDLPIVGGQYPIVDEAPGSGTYSPYWELVYVEASGDYAANDVKSAHTMFLRDDLHRTPSGQVVHCAMIETNTAPSLPDGVTGIALVQLWYQKYLAECLLLEGGDALVEGGLPAFEANRVVVGDVESVPAVDAFFPEVRQWDREIPVPGNILVDVAVDEPNLYTPLVRVNEVKVLWDYVVGSFTDIDQVDDSIIELRSPEQYRDLPIIQGAGR
jgi:hypothetical protein